jgi:hypothetical protein
MVICNVIHGLGDRASIPNRAKIFFFFSFRFQTASGIHLASYTAGTGGGGVLAQSIKRPEREPDDSPLSSAEV